MPVDDNPFFVLGASTRDSTRRLLELAEDLSGALDATLASASRAKLSNPRQRLVAELRWFPGVSPGRARVLAEQASRGDVDSSQVIGLPVLAAINVIASSLSADASPDAAHVQEAILRVATLADSIVPDDIILRINEDRAVAGIPEVEAQRGIASELDVWRAELLTLLAAVLRRLPLERWVRSLTDVVDISTNAGQQHGPLLIHELTDLLAVDVRERLSYAETAVRGECAVLKRMQELGVNEREIVRQAEHLFVALRSWDATAQPFQRSAQARGQEHPSSRKLAFDIREVAVDLHNLRGFTAAAERLSQEMKVVFSDLNRVSATVGEDLVQLAKLRTEKELQQKERAEWERRITVHGTIGNWFKEDIGVTTEAFTHKKTSIGLVNVVALRWGAVRHSVNGVPTGTTYSLSVRSTEQRIDVEFRNEHLFEGLVNSLRQTVLSRLLVEVARTLQQGEHVSFGNLAIRDDGAWLIKDRLFRSAESKFFRWSELQILSSNGSFVISAAKERDFQVTRSYRDHDNTHVLEALLRMHWKVGGTKLSDTVFSGEDT